MSGGWRWAPDKVVAPPAPLLNASQHASPYPIGSTPITTSAKRRRSPEKTSNRQPYRSKSCLTPTKKPAGVTGRWGHLDPTRGRLLSSSSDSEEGDVKQPTPKRRKLAPLANALGFACFRLFVSSKYSHTNTVNNFNTRNPQCR